MSFVVKKILDSVSIDGKRITSIQARYPRLIHAEELTHRVLTTGPELLEFYLPDGVMYERNLSRNASSSRAIPVSRLIEDIQRDPVFPVFWGKNQPGMSAKEECNELVNVCVDSESDISELKTREEAWEWGMMQSIMLAKSFSDAGYHKQIVNRLLEPFSHINVIITATDWTNFFALRRHADAQPEIKVLADMMYDCLYESEPKLLLSGQWHLPYVTEEDIERCKTGFGDPEIDSIENLPICLSAARCARTSYLTHEGKKPNVYDDLLLYKRLAGSVPLHASPCEHQASPDRIICQNPLTWKHPELHGNLDGWIQYRKTLPNECIK